MATGGRYKLMAMRAAFLVLVSLAFFGAIALAALPAQKPLAPTGKMSCCAKAKTEKATDGCARHAPKSDQEKQCCAGCLFCLAVLSGSAAPFVYPPTGEE